MGRETVAHCASVAMGWRNAYVRSSCRVRHERVAVAEPSDIVGERKSLFLPPDEKSCKAMLVVGTGFVT